MNWTDIIQWTIVLVGAFIVYSAALQDMRDGVYRDRLFSTKRNK